MAGPTKLARPPSKLTLAKERLRLVVFGEPGVGKSTLASTFPRPLFIDTDAGLISLAVQGIEPEVFEPTGYKDLEGLYWWCKERRDSFDTIVFDSITTLQRLLLDEIHDLSLSTPGKEVRAPMMLWVPEQGEYLAQQRQTARILTDFRRLGAHVVITAGVKDRLGRRSPDVAPGLFTILSHWASVMGELIVLTHDEKGNEMPKPRRVLVTGHGARDVKSRFATLTPYVPSPSFDLIWKKVQAEYSAAEKRTQHDTKEATA